MKTIRKGDDRIQKILEEQQCIDSPYRIMKYVLKNNCDDGTLLYNTITGKMVLLSKEEVALLEQLPICSSSLNELIHDRFLVPINYSEKDTVHKLRLILNNLY